GPGVLTRKDVVLAEGLVGRHGGQAHRLALTEGSQGLPGEGGSGGVDLNTVHEERAEGVGLAALRLEGRDLTEVRLTVPRDAGDVLEGDGLTVAGDGEGGGGGGGG